LAQNKVITLDKIKIACQNCGLSNICLPLGLDSDDVERLDSIVQRNRPLRRGNYLFQTGDPFKSVYVVKTGTVKTYTQCPDGSEQVIGFHLPDLGHLRGSFRQARGAHRHHPQPAAPDVPAPEP